MAEPEDTGLEEPSAINCAQLTTIQQTGSQSRLCPPPGDSEVRPIGRLSAAKLAAVDRALKYNLGLM